MVQNDNHSDLKTPSLESAKREYGDRLTDLEFVCATALEINDYIKGRLAEDPQYHGSAFFTMICFQLLQIRRMLGPDKCSPIGPMKVEFSIRDSFSPTVMIRSLLESYLHFFYLCVDTVKDEVRKLRFLHWEWHDFNDRIRGLGKKPIDQQGLATLIRKQKELHDVILALPAFRQLSKEWQNRFFKEANPIVMPKNKIAEKAGISPHYFDQIYIFLSSYAHCAPLPVSHHHALTHEKAAQYEMLSHRADYAIIIGCYAIRDIVALFPDARLRVHKKVLDLTRHWSEIVKNWPDPDGE
jgi:hypothetical protein